MRHPYTLSIQTEKKKSFLFLSFSPRPNTPMQMAIISRQVFPHTLQLFSSPQVIKKHMPSVKFCSGRLASACKIYRRGLCIRSQSKRHSNSPSSRVVEVYTIFLEDCNIDCSGGDAIRFIATCPPELDFENS